MTRKQRAAARDEARYRINEVAEHAQEVRINDDIASHWTVWLDGAGRVDWWPGTCHRRVQSDDYTGSFDDFINWIKR